jgi:signal transduction histidine kinase
MFRGDAGVLERRFSSGRALADQLTIADPEFLSWFREYRQPVILDDLDERRSASDIPFARLFLASGWEACLPLAGARGPLGLLVFGRKTTREPFVVGDVELLLTIGAQASIALENARLYDEVRKSRDVIERTGRLSAIGTLAAGIAHEIRNPLVSIQTFFQLAPHRLHDEEFLTSFLKLTEDEVGRICTLITELLNFARTQTHSFRKLALDEEVDRALTLIEPQARREGVSLERTRTPGVDVFVHGDADQIRQVLINLMLNAVQASGKGGTVTITTRLLHRGKIRLCEVEVADTGPGVPDGMMEDIFNPFFTTKEKGTGLGLPIAHQIVTEHGGTIRVENGLGVGATFTVCLPSLEGELTAAASSDMRAAARHAV